MSAHRTDEELMLAYQNGDETAFNELYGRYSGRVYGYLRKRMDQRNWVDDVFQQVFTKMHKSRHQYDPSYRVDQWVFVMTKTVLLDFWKTTGVKTERYFSQSIEDLGPDRSPLAPAPAEVWMPAAELSAELSGLSGDQKAAVEMKFIDELSYEEIARKLGRSEDSARQLVSRGIRKLRAALAGRGEES